MKSADSPFPCGWTGTSLECAGLGALRPRVATYAKYSYEQLPRLPFELRGDFGWLAHADELDPKIGQERAEENAAAFVALRAAAGVMGLRLPREFVTFIESGGLASRIRSNTDCFLDVGEAPVASPVGGGWLVRFLADSQGCVFWYLYLTSDGSDHAVVSSPDFYGAEAEQWDEEEERDDEVDISFCGESFEEFLGRFWLENEIWFAANEKMRMSEAGAEYVRRYLEMGD